MADENDITRLRLSELFKENYKALCLYGVKFVGDMTEAEDLVQDVFVHFHEMYSGRLDSIHARPLLYRMTKNLCIDHLRRKHAEPVDLKELENELNDYFEPESESESTIDLLLAAIRQLPPKCQTIVLAIYVDGKKYKEVAEEMQISVNTVKTQLARGVHLLRLSLHKTNLFTFLSPILFFHSLY